MPMPGTPASTSGSMSEPGLCSVARKTVEPMGRRMSRSGCKAAIAAGGDVVRKFRGVSLGIGLVSAAAIFLVHPGDDAQRAARADMQPLKQFGGRHGDDNPRAVVDGAATEVPGIEMTGDNDVLLGMLAALEVGDNVVAGGVRKALRSEREVHANAALGGEVFDQIGIFGGESGGGNSGGNAVPSVRQAIVGASDGTDKRGDGAKFSRRFGAVSTIANGFAVSLECHAGEGFALVEGDVEEDNFAGNFFAAESGKFVEVVDDDDLRGEAFGGSRRTAADGGENNSLCCLRHLAGIFDELRFFLTANPVGDLRGLQVNLEAEFAHLGGDVFRGSLRLRRSGGARAYVLGQVRELMPGVVAGKSGVAHGLQLIAQLFGKSSCRRSALRFFQRSLGPRAKTGGEQESEERSQGFQVELSHCGSSHSEVLILSTLVFSRRFLAGNRECTGARETKKAAPFGATLFKEAKWRESEVTQFGAAPGM